MDNLFIYLTPSSIAGKAIFALKYVLVLNLFILCLELLIYKKESSLIQIFKNTKEHKHDLFFFIFNSLGLKKGLANFFSFGLIALFQEYSSNNDSIPIFSMTTIPPILSFIIMFITYDFLLYWLHRLRHRSSILWPSHSFHHSAKKITVFTNTRQHALDYINFFFFILFPMSILFPVSLMDLFSWFLLEAGIQALAHSKLDFFSNNFLGSIFVGSKHHLIHHSINSSDQRKNFASVFIFWDKLFDTYQSSENKNLEFGLEGALSEEESLIKAYAIPFIATFKALISKGTHLK